MNNTDRAALAEQWRHVARTAATIADAYHQHRHPTRTEAAALTTALQAAKHLEHHTRQPHTRSAPSSPLTPRQHTCLAAIATGHTQEHIAHDLGISLDTVKTHLQAAYRRLGAHSGIQAVTTAIRTGILH